MNDNETTLDPTTKIQDTETQRYKEWYNKKIRLKICLPPHIYIQPTCFHISTPYFFSLWLYYTRNDTQFVNFTNFWRHEVICQSIYLSIWTMYITLRRPLSTFCTDRRKAIRFVQAAKQTSDTQVSVWNMCWLLKKRKNIYAKKMYKDRSPTLNMCA